MARAGGPGATTGPWTAEAQRFGLSQLTYDANGNILTLARRGLLAPATRTTPAAFGPVDQLTYAYAGNRLQAVTDQVSGNELPRPPGYMGAPTSLAGDFQQPSTRPAQEYDYDVSGNLTADHNKGIVKSGVLYQADFSAKLPVPLGFYPVVEAMGCDMSGSGLVTCSVCAKR